MLYSFHSFTVLFNWPQLLNKCVTKLYASAPVPLFIVLGAQVSVPQSPETGAEAVYHYHSWLSSCHIHHYVTPVWNTLTLLGPSLSYASWCRLITGPMLISPQQVILHCFAVIFNKLLPSSVCSLNTLELKKLFPLVKLRCHADHRNNMEKKTMYACLSLSLSVLFT